MGAKKTKKLKLVIPFIWRNLGWLAPFPLIAPNLLILYRLAGTFRRKKTAPNCVRGGI